MKNQTVKKHVLKKHVLKKLKLGLPKDYSKPKGKLKSAIVYSFYGAMNPRKKETAFLHLPTYTAGIIYHIGTFTAILLFFLFLANVDLPKLLRHFLVFIFAISILCGFGILLKRIILKILRSISVADDYISNLLVTLFQFFSLLMLVCNSVDVYYYICVTILLLYIPIGKLKHSLYFFSARIQLGYFYGWRGIWNPR